VLKINEILSTIETAYLKKAMEIAGGNKSKAAVYLNLGLKIHSLPRLDKCI